MLHMYCATFVVEVCFDGPWKVALMLSIVQHQYPQGEVQLYNLLPR